MNGPNNPEKPTQGFPRHPLSHRPMDPALLAGRIQAPSPELAFPAIRLDHHDRSDGLLPEDNICRST